jgi:hypothetical protein
MVHSFQNSKNVNEFHGMHTDNSVIKKMLLNLFYENVLQLFEVIYKVLLTNTSYKPFH